MIVISGALVLVALVLLIVGLVGQGLTFVYASIAVSLAAFVFLLLGILQRRGEPDAAPAVGAGGGSDRLSGDDGEGVTVVPAPATAATLAPPAEVSLAKPEPQEARREPEPVAQEEPEPPVEDDGELLSDVDEAELDEIDTTVLVVPGRPRYHIDGCRYLYGKDVEEVHVLDAREEGFTPCGVCKPDAVLVADLESLPVDPGPAAAPGLAPAAVASQGLLAPEQPVAEDDRSVEEPVFEESVVEESAAEDSAAEEPAVEEPRHGEPVPEDVPVPAPVGEHVGEPDDEVRDVEPLAVEEPGSDSPVADEVEPVAPVPSSPRRGAVRLGAEQDQPARTRGRAATAEQAAGSAPTGRGRATKAASPVKRPAKAPSRAAAPAPSRRGAAAAAKTAPGAVAPATTVPGTAAAAKSPATRARRSPAAAAAAAAGPARRGTVVVIPDRGKFHRPECRYVRDVPSTQELTKVQAGRQGYAACGVCRP